MQLITCPRNPKLAMRQLSILVFISFFAACAHQLQFDEALNSRPDASQLAYVEGYIYVIDLDNFVISSAQLNMLSDADQLSTTECIRMLVNERQKEFISENRGAKARIVGLTKDATKLNSVAQEVWNSLNSTISIRGRYWGIERFSNCRAKTAVFVKHISILE